MITITRYMYDYDGNGVLDQNDFECLAVRNTILEGKGSWCPEKYEKNKQVMINLWQQICEIADFDKNNEVDTEEFMRGVEAACKGKAYGDLPEAFKFFIEAQFRTIDVDGELYSVIQKKLQRLRIVGSYLEGSNYIVTTFFWGGVNRS